MNFVSRYTRWLHTRWPAGTVEPFPVVGDDGSTRMPGLHVVGDLTGVPLLKFSLDSGARVVERIAADLAVRRGRDRDDAMLDLVIIGAGVSGMAAAMEARARGLRFEVLEASARFSTLANFPKGKPIYTYPRDMKPAGGLQVSANVKEALIDELVSQADRAGIAVTMARVRRVARDGSGLRVEVDDGSARRARHVVIAIGRSGDYRRLGVPGDDLSKVFHRLHDPADFGGARVLVIGGGDSAIETAIALANAGAHVTLAHRGREFSRPRPENLEILNSMRAEYPERLEHPRVGYAAEAPQTRPAATAIRAEPAPVPGAVAVRLETVVREIRAQEVVLRGHDGDTVIENDVVFSMTGRETPLDLFRRSGLPIAGGMSTTNWIAMAAFMVFCTWLYNWKSGGFFSNLWYRNHWFPTNLPDLLAAAGGAIATQANDPASLIGTLAISASGPSFYYTLAYSIVVVVFGIRRIRRRKTPYVTAQSLTLMLVQVLPLFLIPEILLPLLNSHGLLPLGIADALFPVADYGHGREFWRAYGLILAWPLNVYNIFTHEPLWAWITIGFVQTCVLIPIGVWFFGKGAYCGWICSCGALAETLGDTHRHKMPHGPGWNRFNMAGQVILGIALILLVVRIAGWALPDGNWADRAFPVLQSNYKWWVDVFLAGIVGYGVYFWYSGRFWCRFLCPLAALMNIYARFSSFRILADKKKCISCGQCTRVCHQGIDVMNFANKGVPMADPECVRCSACVHTCPTGVLSFGRVNRTGQLIGIDSLMASPVQIREGKR